MCACGRTNPRPPHARAGHGCRRGTHCRRGATPWTRTQCHRSSSKKGQSPTCAPEAPEGPETVEAHEEDAIPPLCLRRMPSAGCEKRSTITLDTMSARTRVTAGSSTAAGDHVVAAARQALQLSCHYTRCPRSHEQSLRTVFSLDPWACMLVRFTAIRRVFHLSALTANSPHHFQFIHHEYLGSAAAQPPVPPLQNGRMCEMSRKTTIASFFCISAYFLECFIAHEQDGSLQAYVDRPCDQCQASDVRVGCD